MANSGSLVGKVALITGGSRGIGAAIVRRLAKEGATVAFTYSSSPEKAEGLQATVENAGGRALAIKADSADVEAVRKAVELIIESFGKLDILVNSAGILLRGTIDAFTVEDFDHMDWGLKSATYSPKQAAATTNEKKYSPRSHQESALESSETPDAARIIFVHSDRTAIPTAEAFEFKETWLHLPL